MSATKRINDDATLQRTPSKVAKTAESITGYVSKVPANVLLSPSRNGRKGKEYFNFCLTTKQRRYRCVSFSKQHIQVLSPANNKKDCGVMITGYIQEPNNDIKLGTHCLIKIVPLKEKYDPEVAKQVHLADILTSEPVNTDVSITCVVNNYSTYDAVNCLVHNYLLADATGKIKLSAFEILPLEVNKSYVIEDLLVSAYKNEKLVKFMVNSNISKSKKDVSPAEQIRNKFTVTVSQFNKGEASTQCEKCFEPIQVDDGVYLCGACNHVSTSAKKVFENALITVVHEDGRKQSLSFVDLSIFDSIFGKLDSFSMKEYKVLLTNKFDICVDGSELMAIAKTKKEQ